MLQRQRALLAVGLLSMNVGHGVLAQSVSNQPGDVPSIRLTYRPSDLATEAGIRTVLRRIESAAGIVCQEDLLDSRNLGIQAWLWACKQHAVAQAVASVHSATLAEAYKQRFHSTVPAKALVQNAAAEAADQKARR